MRVRRIADGTVFKIRTGMPIGGEFQSGISTWCQRGGSLVLLADRPDRTAAAPAGSYDMYARRVEYVAAPLEGQISR